MRLWISAIALFGAHVSTVQLLDFAAAGVAPRARICRHQDRRDRAHRAAHDAHRDRRDVRTADPVTMSVPKGKADIRQPRRNL